MKLLDKLEQLLHLPQLLKESQELNRQWLERFQQVTNDLQEAEIHKQQLLCSIEEEKKEKQEAEARYKALKERFNKLEEVREYYETIDMPSSPLKDIEENLKNSDKYTIRVIQEYLKIDNQEMVANLAGAMNIGNKAMVVAYKDGAIGRNKALIQKLETLKKDTFYDKLEGTKRVIGKAEKES